MKYKKLVFLSQVILAKKIPTLELVLDFWWAQEDLNLSACAKSNSFKFQLSLDYGHCLHHSHIFMHQHMTVHNVRPREINETHSKGN